MSWLKNLDSSVLEYVYNLKKEDSDFSFFPVQKLLTKNGEKLNLGFSCYALKIFKLLITLTSFLKVRLTIGQNI